MVIIIFLLFNNTIVTLKFPILTILTAFTPLTIFALFTVLKLLTNYDTTPPLLNRKLTLQFTALFYFYFLYLLKYVFFDVSLMTLEYVDYV